jgi:hypothetical protein
LTAIAIEHGSSETGMIADIAKPTGSPCSGSKLVTIATGAGRWRSTRLSLPASEFSAGNASDAAGEAI